MIVRYLLKMEALIEETDSGYMGSGASLAEHLKYAQDNIQYMQWYLERGATGKKPVQVKMTVAKIIYEPDL